MLAKFDQLGSCQIDEILRDGKTKPRRCCLFTAGEHKRTESLLQRKQELIWYLFDIVSSMNDLKFDGSVLILVKFCR